jgi:DNA-binding transcriptional MerR regulator
MPEDTSDPDQRLYPIRTVASLTGVNPVTLRAWERRYGLIRPRRTQKGHRLYTEDDVQLIQRVLGYLKQGIAVGQVKRLVNAHGEPPQPEVSKELVDPWSRYETGMLDAIARFDEPALDAIYHDVLSLYPIEIVSTRLIAPLLKHLGSSWRDDQAGIAREHFFSTYLRIKLGTRLHHLNTQGSGARLLAACLPGEYHEIGLLQFCLSAVSHGYRFVLLGPNLPLEQLITPAARAHCRAIVLSGTTRPRGMILADALPRLVQSVAIPVFVGGQCSLRQGEIIRDAGATPLGSDIPAALQIVSRRLKA